MSENITKEGIEVKLILERTNEMSSEQSFILGVVGLLIATTLATVAGWVAGVWLWFAMAILAVGAVVGGFGMMMLWRSWRTHTQAVVQK